MEIKVITVPEGITYSYAKSTDPYSLDDYDRKELEGYGFEKVALWYAPGSYEGDGQLIGLKGGKFYLHGCGHCSCYGPFDNINLNNGYDDLDSLLASCPDSYKIEIEPVVEAMREMTRTQTPKD